MKKRLMMVAVLVGALSLSACVDNKESDSVTAVRTAKAAQLNALAAVSNAEAEAKKAITAAEVAYKEAEAAFQKAQAEAEQADADMKKIELEKAKAGLTFALEAAKIQAEAELEEAKAKLETAKAELITNLDKVDQATKERINTLIGKADKTLNGLTGTDGINGLRLKLVKEKNNLASAKYELITAEEDKAREIAGFNREIATAKTLIAEFEKYSTASFDGAQTAANEAAAKLEGLTGLLADKKKEEANAQAAYNAAVTYTGETAYGKKVSDNAYYFDSEVVQKSEPVEVVHFDGAKELTPSTAVNKYVLNARFTAAMNTASRELAISTATYQEAVKALNDKKASQGYKDQQKAVTDAQTEFNKAVTAAEKQAAKDILDVAETGLASMTTGEESTVNSAKLALESYTKKKADLDTILANVSGDNATVYDAAIANEVATSKVRLDATIAQVKVAYEEGVQSALYTALKAVADDLTDFADLISTQKNNITTAEKGIANMEEVITAEDLIAKRERNIAQYESDLKAQEQIYASYMAQIEALIKE